jgi:tetratricopeptide (TPR) repeat protein
MGELATAYRERVSALAARLDAPDAAEQRDALRGELIALGKSLESDIVELMQLKDEAKTLVEKWKGLRLSMAPAFSAERPVVADHIGASTFIEKGWSRISLGDYAGAEESLTKALQLAPGDPQAESLLGWAQMLQEKYDDALMQFQKVLMREPGNALARINVGYICLKKGIFGEAIEHLSKAIRLDNDKKATLYAHFYLGLVYLERDMFEDAQTFFQKSLALGPNLIEAYYELGRAYWFNGQRAEAMQTWRDGFAANKFNPWGKRCAEVLQTVEQGGEP